MKRALIMVTGLWMVAIHFYSPRAGQSLDALSVKRASAAAVSTAVHPVLMARAEYAEQH